MTNIEMFKDVMLFQGDKGGVILGLVIWAYLLSIVFLNIIVFNYSFGIIGYMFLGYINGLGIRMLILVIFGYDINSIDA